MTQIATTAQPAAHDANTPTDTDARQTQRPWAMAMAWLERATRQEPTATEATRPNVDAIPGYF
jgi:hypothetical protein